jgi:hypothetical protein
MISQEDSAIATPSLTDRREFLKLPLEERRRILTLQADQAADYYESLIEQAEREEWQGGDVVE